MFRIARCIRVAILLSLALLLYSAAAQAQVVTYYGDDDGFGIGATTGTIDPNVSHANPGEAPYTDVRLIGGAFPLPGFTPTGSFDSFTLPAGSTITSATLTMRAGSLVTGTDPVGGPNQLLLDSMAVDPAFFDLFTANTNSSGNNIETVSYPLPAAFYPLLADGSVSLNGTRVSEDNGSGSFQVDFLRLDITTSAGAVPEPGLLAFGAASVLGLLRLRPRRRS